MKGTFNARSLTSKLGAVRLQNSDFYDDGAFFKAYSYKGVVFTYTKFEYEYFLAIRVDLSTRNLVWDDYCDTDWYKETNKFNGTTDVDIEEFRAILERVKAGIEKIEKELENYTPDVDLLIKCYNEDTEKALEYVERLKKEFKWYEADKYTLSRAVTCVKDAENMKKLDPREYFSKFSVGALRSYERCLNIKNYNVNRMASSIISRVKEFLGEK